MNECDHTIDLDGIEYSLWDARIDCPYCRIAELEAELKIQDDANEILERRLVEAVNANGALLAENVELEAKVEKWEKARELLIVLLRQPDVSKASILAAMEGEL